MTLILDLPGCSESLLGRRDPRGKLLAFGLAIMGVCVLRGVSASGAACVGMLFLAALAQLPRKWLLRRLGATALMLLVFVLFLPFLVHKGGPAWEWGGLRVSRDGIEAAVLLFLKANALVGLMLILLATTPLPLLLHAAHALCIPGLLVQLMLLTHRYVFVVVEELGRFRVALRTRGYRNRMSRHSYRTIGHVTGTLLLRSQDRAERVGQAMRCRGFDGRFRSLAEFRAQPQDVVLVLLMVTTVGCLIVGDYLLL